MEGAREVAGSVPRATGTIQGRRGAAIAGVWRSGDGAGIVTGDRHQGYLRMAITIERFVQQMEKLKADMDAGSFEHGEYDQRLARIIAELRDRKLEADRGAITKTLDDLLGRGVITPAVKNHLEKRLGLT